MKTNPKKPEITSVSKGTALKILQVAGESGTVMHRHYSTKEVAVTITEGSAIVEINGEESILKQGESILIPEKQSHSLTAITRLKAIVILPSDSRIEFAK